MMNKRTLKQILLRTTAMVLSDGLISIQEAAAFSAPFIKKVNEISDHLVLIGKALVGVAAVMAIMMALTNKGPNWRWIITIAAVGAALVSFDIIKIYILQ